uniref:Delta-aminolevulinic acid dehydratase n=1 Tax=Amphimedon queenslandica TaxID=400682 RepID=A0A1X7SSR5_AMPQE
AISSIKAACPDLVIITDVCVCEYTDHGHCGLLSQGHPHLPDGYVLNDESVDILARVSLSHALAGADIVAPSAMLDGMVAGIRKALDGQSFHHLPIMSYAVKYASAFYGPFRDAAQGAPKFGDRRSHQMDPANAREALKEAAIDVEEGADFLMVKPALAYLDIIARVRERFPEMPMVAYNTSGEYAMVKAASERGWLDERATVLEKLTAIKRAGADLIISYHALEAAAWQGCALALKEDSPISACRIGPENTPPSPIRATVLRGSPRGSLRAPERSRMPPKGKRRCRIAADRLSVSDADAIALEKRRSREESDWPMPIEGRSSTSAAPGSSPSPKYANPHRFGAIFQGQPQKDGPRGISLLRIGTGDAGGRKADIRPENLAHPDSHRLGRLFRNHRTARHTQEIEFDFTVVGDHRAFENIARPGDRRQPGSDEPAGQGLGHRQREPSLAQHIEGHRFHGLRIDPENRIPDNLPDAHFLGRDQCIGGRGIGGLGGDPHFQPLDAAGLECEGGIAGGIEGTDALFEQLRQARFAFAPGLEHPASNRGLHPGPTPKVGKDRALDHLAHLRGHPRHGVDHSGFEGANETGSGPRHLRDE